MTCIGGSIKVDLSVAEKLQHTHVTLMCSRMSRCTTNLVGSFKVDLGVTEKSQYSQVTF